MADTLTRDFMKIFQGPQATMNSIILSVIVVLLTIVFMWLIARSRNTRRTILIIGLTDSGKTVLFGRLHESLKKYLMTQTSMKENKGIFLGTPGTKKEGKNLELLDLPGDDRIRTRYIEQYKDTARGIIFVVDSINFPREIKDVAEFLYDILGHRTLAKRGLPILMVCNKQDMSMAKSSTVIKLQLEKELNTLRVTRSAALAGQDSDSANDNVIIGKKGKQFEFAHVSPIKVEFVECSAKGKAVEEPQINEVKDWLNKIM